MSAQVIELPARQQHRAPELRPEIRDILDRMASRFIQYPDYEELSGGLAFDNRVGRTTVSFRGVVPRSIDGRKLTEVAEVRTELYEEFQGMSDPMVADLNSWASLGAALREPETGRVVVYSRCPIYTTDDAVLGHYGLLLHAAAMAHDDQVIAGVCVGAGRDMPEHLRQPIRGEDDEAPWGLADFRAWAKRLNERRLPATATADSLMASLPWSPAADFPGTDRGSGIVLVLHTGIPHPLLGSGLHCRLELPVEMEDDDIVAWVNRLNLLERERLSAGPGFGAWCPVPGQPRIAWLSFLPDIQKMRGLLDTIMSDLLLRAQKAGWMTREDRKWLQ